MIRARTLRTPAEIAAILEDFDDSGLSVAAFCREEGLPSSTVHLWLRKRTAAAELGATSRTFQRVEIVPSPTAHAPPTGFEFIFPSGVTMRVYGPVDPAHLELAIASVFACSD